MRKDDEGDMTVVDAEKNERKEEKSSMTIWYIKVTPQKPNIRSH